jgi:hypothetical protein
MYRVAFFSKKCEAPASNYEVWSRVLNGNPDDKAVLFVGQSNTVSWRYGDEGVDIFPETPKCGRTGFFNGGASNMDGGLVDQKVYNHLYGDFYFLDSQFPYLVNSSFFDLICIGAHTLCYMYEDTILEKFSSMLRDCGRLIVAGGPKSWNVSRSFPTIFEDNYSVTPFLSPLFFECNGKNNDKAIGFSEYVDIALKHTDFCGPYVIHRNCYENCREDFALFRENLEKEHPFMKRFFMQNEKSASAFVVVERDDTNSIAKCQFLMTLRKQRLNDSIGLVV